MDPNENALPESPARVLIAEDEPLQRKVLEHLLSQNGYEVENAVSGEEALGKLKEGRIQLLITDWDMPGMDGAALCRQIRKAQLPGYVYILMLTSHSGTSDAVAGLDAGADDYLKKPADGTELLARIRAGRRIIELERSLSSANARVQRLSITDALVGCYNRRYFNEQLVREIERSRRYGVPLSLIMMDLDHFKKVNDEHGHIVGDEVLAMFAQRTLPFLRASSDWLARYGGEEFALVLPHSNLSAAAEVAEKVRTACVAAPLNTTAGSLTITVSLGAAELASSPELNMVDLLTRADAALYRSKHAGRNRVTLSRTSD